MTFILPGHCGKMAGGFSCLEYVNIFELLRFFSVVDILDEQKEETTVSGC